MAIGVRPDISTSSKNRRRKLAAQKAEEAQQQQIVDWEVERDKTELAVVLLGVLRLCVKNTIKEVAC